VRRVGRCVQSTEAHKRSVISPSKQSSRSATGTGTVTSTSSGTTDAVNWSSSSAELCESHVMSSSASAATLNQILRTYVYCSQAVWVILALKSDTW